MKKTFSIVSKQLKSTVRGCPTIGIMYFHEKWIVWKTKIRHGKDKTAKKQNMP
jgi:hypothetical protein